MDDCGGFWRVQRRLQEEARVALALARPMARMQVEVERQIQMHRRSPVADLVSQSQKSKEFVSAYEGLPSIFNLQKKQKTNTITKGLSKLYKANYNKVNQEIQKYIEIWSKLTLDFSSRIQIIRMNV